MRKVYNSLRILFALVLVANVGAFAQTTTFNVPSTSPYFYTVPPNVTLLSLTVNGAKGGINSDVTNLNAGGCGGRVTARLVVTAGQVLQVYVGGCGADGVATATGGGAGGINGGGAGATGFFGGYYSGGGGGGASTVLDAGGILIIEAGGGGGAGNACGDEAGGAGGANTGQTGSSLCTAGGGGGGGGTGPGGIGSGGDGGNYPLGVGLSGSAGTATSGGDAGVGAPGGGGGGGYGGGGGGQYGGGGGGANYALAGPTTVTGNNRGVNCGCGSVTITVACIPGTAGPGIALCVGDTGTVTASQPSGVWSSSNHDDSIGAASGIVTALTNIYHTNAANAGIDTAIYTMGPGCSVYSIVTVNPLPPAVGGIPPSFPCVGQNSSLTDGLPGKWMSIDTAVATIDSNTGVLTGVAPGLDSVVFTATGTGCQITSPGFNIYPVPGPITTAGAFAVCAGGAITLSDTTGILYTGAGWGFTPSSGSIVVTPTPGSPTPITVSVNATAPAGTISVLFSYGGHCLSYATITVNPLPALSGPNVACIGHTAQETAIPPGGTWSSAPVGAIGSIGSASGIVTPLLTSGSAAITVTYVDLFGCVKTKVVTVNPSPAPVTIPIGSGDSVCVGSTLTLSDATSASTTYTWTSSATATATVSTSGVVTGKHAGTVTITFTSLSTQCYQDTTIQVNPTPVITSGRASICMGDNTDAFTADLTGGTWTSSVPSVGTIDPTGAFTTAGPGVTTIAYTLPTGACAATLSLTVNPLPGPVSIDPLGSPSACDGDNGTPLLEDITDPGGTWSIVAPSTETITTETSGEGSVSSGPASAGDVFTVLYTLPTGCTTTFTMTIFPTPPPITLVSGYGTTICPNQITKLYDASPGGSWVVAVGNTLASVVSGSPSDTGIVTGLPTLVGGLVEIDYISDHGCLTTSPYTIAVNPAVDAFTDHYFSFSGCVGDNPYTLDADPSQPDLTWKSSDTDVAQVVAIPPSPSTSATLTVKTAGVTTISYTDGLGCSYTEDFTVNPVPAPITGTFTVCQGDTVTLNDATPGGYWFDGTGTSIYPGGTSHLISNPTVSPALVVGTSYGTPEKIFYILSATSCQTTVNVVVNQVPNAITPDPLTLCNGTSGTLSAVGSAAGTWGFVGGFSNPYVSFPFGPPPTATTVTVNATAIGTAVLKYTLTVDGCPAYVTVNVSGYPSPITGTRFNVCQGSAITLNESVVGTWTSTSGVTTTTPGGGVSTSASVTGITPGIDTITFSNGAGCPFDTTITVNDTPSSLITPLGSLTICAGGFVELTAGTGPGYAYQWNKLGPGGGAIGGATTATYLATPTAPGASYDLTISNGTCGITSIPTTVAVSSISGTLTSSASGGGFSACASVGITLSVNPSPSGVGVSYQWTDGGVAVPGAVTTVYTPTVSGTYGVLLTNSIGCTATETALVSLVASPDATITAAGAVSFCAGGNVELDANPGYIYQWYSPLGTAIAGATDASFTATVSGTYYVKDSILGSCSTTSPVGISVVSNPLPGSSIALSGSSTIFCYGTPMLLTASPSAPGNSYQWFDNSVPIAGATTAFYSADTTGNYTLRVTTAASCADTSTISALAAVVAPILAPFTATSFCWGSSALLTATVVGGIGTPTYVWALDGIVIPGAVTNHYVATAPGVYSFSVTAGGCTSLGSSSTTTVTEHMLPDPVITYNSQHLYVQGFYTSYFWYLNGLSTPISSGPTDSVIAALSSGSYTVKVTDTFGCQSISLAYVLHSTASVPVNITGADVKIFPNPAQNVVHIQAPVTVRAVISSVDGRTLIDQPAATDIDISNLADGMYMIMIYDASGQMLKTGKVVKATN